MHSAKAWAFQDIVSHHDRTPRNKCIADSDTCSSHDAFGTCRRKCTGALYVRLFGIWYRRDSDTRSSCDGVLTCCIPCNSLGSPCIRSHVRHCHSKRRPCFDLNFPFLSFLTAAAVTDPADDLPAVSRDPADGLSAAFLRPRCWTPDGRTWREHGIAMGQAANSVVCF